MTLADETRRPVAVAPLVGNQQDEEWNWLGALLARLLADHIRAADMPVLGYNAIASQIISGKYALPLEVESAEILRRKLNLQALIHGRYILDEGGKMFALRLRVARTGPALPPLEAATPLESFPRFIGSISLAILDRLEVKVNDEIRQNVSSVRRPQSLEALRQLARARAAWARGENHLALTAVNAALDLDRDMEEAMLIEVAIARDANDAETARTAFRRWAALASRQNQLDVAAERITMSAHWLADRGEWVDARQAYEDARALYKRINSERGEAAAQNNITNLEMLQGKIGNSIRSYRRNLRTFEETPGQVDDVAIACLNLAIAHKNQGQHKEAETALERAFDLAQQVQNTRIEAHCLAQRGALYDDMGRWAEASSDYTRAESLFDVVGDDVGRALVKTHQAVLLKQQANYSEALNHLREADTILQKQNTPHEQAIVQYNMAAVYVAMREYEQAWPYAERATQTFERLKSAQVENAQDLMDMVQDVLDDMAAEAEEPASPPAVVRPAAPPARRESYTPPGGTEQERLPGMPSDRPAPQVEPPPFGSRQPDERRVDEGNTPFDADEAFNTRPPGST